MWVLLVVMYTGQVYESEYSTQAYCENALISVVDEGRHKHIKNIECVLND